MRNKLRTLAALAAVASAVFGQTSATAIKISDRAAARLLDQATWGPTPASILQAQQMGVDGWLKSQFALKTSDLPDQPVLGSDGKPNRDLRPVQEAFFNNAVTGQDQLRQRVAFALSQIWVVSALEVPDAYAFPAYWRIFRDNAFGNYRDIVKAVTLSPAMGRYLNMANNNKGNPAKGTAANENYGRELMQLFTLGLTQLNSDGTPVLDGKGHPLPTYTQAEVTGISRALTGWTYPTATGATPKSNNPPYYIGEMYAVESNHDTTSKTIFGGITLPAGQTAEQDLESVLNAMMRQETMAPFVSQQLIEHLVTSNPSPTYIRNVSKVFLDNGLGVRGDMRAVIDAILTDPEARAGDSPNGVESASFGHLREPLLFVANVLRGLNATLGPQSAIYNNSSTLGQNLFYPPSVFSYFSPGYRTEKGLLGPEFQIYSTQTAAQRADFTNTVLYGSLDKSTKVDLTPFIQHDTSTSALLDYVSYVFLHHGASNELLIQASAAVDAVPKSATSEMKRAAAALYILLTSGEYQVIH